MKTIDISGMGGHYEESCQKLLWTGIRYLQKIDNPFELFKGSHPLNVKATKDTEIAGGLKLKKGEIVRFHGVLVTPPSLKEMEEEMSKSVNGDWTGMQHETVIGHLEKIAEHGYLWWLKQFEDQPKRIYEINVTKLLGLNKK